MRSVAFDPGNERFCTGSADRTIEIWDLASGALKLTLTGHVGQVRGLVVSQRHPYLFSAGDDKVVKCWDLEQNKVIRSYQPRRDHQALGSRGREHPHAPQEIRPGYGAAPEGERLVSIGVGGQRQEVWPAQWRLTAQRAGTTEDDREFDGGERGRRPGDCRG